MPRNTRASKRKNDDSDLAQTPTPSKKKAQTPSTTPQSTKTRKNNKNSPKAEATTPSNKRTKRKLDEESAGEESSPSASPKSKKRDTRTAKPKVKSPVVVEPIEEESVNTKKQSKTAPTPPRTSTRRSKRNSSVCANDSVNESKVSDEEKASPTPKKIKTQNTVTQKTPQKKENPKKEQEIVAKVKKVAKIIEKAPLPRKLSREEIYQNYLKTLELKLNRFDLSTKEDGSGDMFSKWPDSEVMNNIKKNPLLNRIWYSKDGSNGASLEKTVGEFNVASYDIKEIKSGSDNFTQVFSLIKEEIGYIDADVFCIQNVSSDCEKNLLSCLGERKYTFSGPNHGCVIGFRDKKFTIIDSKVITPNQTLIEFIDKTSYPTAWKDSLKASIDHPNSLNSCPLIIHVLKHIESGVLVLLASQSQLNREEMKSEDSLLSRPDLNALNVTSIMWSICRAWTEIVEKKNKNIDDKASSRNMVKNNSNGNHNKTTKGCWLFCGSLNASHESPIYQLIRDGYPCDDTINRLRCIRSVNLELGPKELKAPEGDSEREICDDNSMKKSLIDLIWHAFQHPQTDVASCYADVIGREPPFTQISSDSKNNGSPTTSKCDHYIWCSKSSLRPKAVLLTPCRALMSGVKEPNINSYSIPLAAKIEIISNC